jgi:predicted dienelactone hydrolase
MIRNKLRRKITLGAVTLVSLAVAGLHRHAWANYQKTVNSDQKFIDFDWLDASRNRVVPVRFYEPSQNSNEPIPSPLVVFSHGLGGSRTGYSYLALHFASHGIASLHLQHVGSDRNVWGGNVFGMVERIASALQTSESIARVQDLSFALDMLFSSDLANYIDKSRVAAAGHSYGANTALLAAGALVRQDGQFKSFTDKRIRAAVAISAPHYYGKQDTSRSLGSVLIPSLHITATEDNIRMPGYFSSVEDRLDVFEATGSAMKWLAVFEGGSHSVFTDRIGTGGIALNPKIKLATAELATVFLKTVFEDNESVAKEWTAKHGDIIAKSIFKS